MKNIILVNLTKSSTEKKFVETHLIVKGCNIHHAYPHTVTAMSSEIVPVLEETPIGGVCRVLRVEDVKEPFNSELETFLMVISNRTRWVSNAYQPVEQLGRPGGRYGCIALLPAGVDLQVLPYKEARKSRKTHWWVVSTTAEP